MTGLNVGQFRELVIRPTLQQIGLHSDAAELLVLGTGIVESNLTFLHQNGGPALGIFQMEPATHDWLSGELGTRPSWAKLKVAFNLIETGQAPLDQLVTNLAYATAMCRLRYYIVPTPLPAADDLDGLGEYWKHWFNTDKGSGVAGVFTARLRAALQ